MSAPARCLQYYRDEADKMYGRNPGGPLDAAAVELIRRTVFAPRPAGEATGQEAAGAA